LPVVYGFAIRVVVISSSAKGNPAKGPEFQAARELSSGATLAKSGCDHTSGAMELPKTVEECHELIHRLLEENAALRQSGASFGHLAERLNSELQDERRMGRERRLVHRTGDDRRAEAADARPEKLTR
jgi:hypothetical protein